MSALPAAVTPLGGLTLAPTIPRSQPKPSPLPLRQPLLWASLAYATGIVLGSEITRPIALWLAAIGIFILSAAYFTHRRTWLAFSLALAALVALGALAIQLRTIAAPIDTRLFDLADGRELHITAQVFREGEILPSGSYELRQRIDVQTEQIADGGRALPIQAGLRLTVYKKATAEPMHLYRYGERLQFPAKLRLPRNFRNPGAFDYQGYLADNGIRILGSAKAGETELLPASLPNSIGIRIESARSRAHRSIRNQIHALWQPREAALMDAAVLGEDAFLTPATRIDFQRSGTYHILVVSGMNVGILAFVIFWTMRRLRVSEAIASLLTVLSSVAYAYLTQVGPPVWRSVLMVTVYLAVRLLYRSRSMLNAWGAAALAVMVVNPKALLGASFQMTFLSVLIIAAIGVPLLARTSAPYRKGLRNLNAPSFDRQLPPRIAQFRLDLRLIAGRLAQFVGDATPLPILGALARTVISVYDILCISTLMQCGLVLPMAYYFHRATVIGLPANSVAVPLTGVLMPAAVAAIALSYIALPLARIPAWIAAWAMTGITGTVRWLGGLRIAEYRVATPQWPAILFALVALGIAMLLARRRRSLAISGLAVLASSALYISLIPPTPQIHRNTMELTAIDVGEGDAILVVSPEGKTLLIDAGGPVGGQPTDFDYGENVVSPYLWNRGIQRLDAVALSHGHSDHMGGMHAVLKNFLPKEIWIGVLPHTPATDAFLADASSLDIPVVRKNAGESFFWNGARVEVLAPPADQPALAQPRNDDSLVLHMHYGATSMLLEGDAEKAVERAIAAQFHPHADLLKVGHHGSATSTTPQLIDSVHPQYAVISLGFRNSYGFPRPDVLQRLQAAHVRTYRTDATGATSFYLDGKTIAVQPPCSR
jgi:competence protein ComEC